RTETDTGTVSILDKRLVSKRYGAQLLDALPPFRREIG
ncbi:MAG: helicase C-terminal domain-containing protein, partial [Porticoccaceae bacterium]